jgi:hypothetical protein
MSEENKVVPMGRIFTDRKLWLGSMLGGPLIAGYIIYKNYQVFNESKKAKTVIFVTILCTIFIFFGIFSLPDNINIPNQLIPFLYTGIAWGFLKKYQGNRIEEHINSGGELIGWGKTLIVSILGLVVTIIPIFLLLLIFS